MGHGRTTCSRRRATGFSLIEILVVLVIIGVVLTFATLSLDPTGPSDRLNTAAQRLLALTQAASDQAILSGRTMGLQLTDNGYDFVTLTDNGWQTITSDDSALHPRRLDDDLHINRISVDGDDMDASGDNDHSAARQAATLMLPPSPIAPTPGQAKQQAADATAAEKNGHPSIPAALFLASGELLPFKLALSADGVDHRFDIIGAPNGDITLQRVDR